LTFKEANQQINVLAANVLAATGQSADKSHLHILPCKKRHSVHYKTADSNTDM